MNVLIKFYGVLAKLVENNKLLTKVNDYKKNDLKDYIELSIDSSIDVTGILKMLNITEKSVALITINGKKSKPDSLVRDGDKIKLYPFVAGG